MKPNIIMLGFFRESVQTDQLVEYRDQLKRKAATKIIPDHGQIAAVDDLMQHFPPMEQDRRENKDCKITAEEYVETIRDVLVLQKNIGIERNFHRVG